MVNIISEMHTKNNGIPGHTWKEWLKLTHWPYRVLGKNVEKQELLFTPDGNKNQYYTLQNT